MIIYLKVHIHPKHIFYMDPMVAVDFPNIQP